MSRLIPTYIEQGLRIEQLERELAEARKDAERYRWLRDNSYSTPIRSWLAGDELDDNIDAAMKEGGK
tara:strand:+ start:144 stop:344 length:201 start_codon:yes stop_codon:yes gene_type:complete